MATLITFLGAARERGGYRTARYRFPDGEESAPTSFFGLALFRWLAASGRTPDRLVMLGTRHSMWGELAYFGEDETLLDTPVWTQLEAGQGTDGGVDDAVLADAERELAGLLDRAGHGSIRVDLAPIPYGRDRSEQVAILHALADCVADGEQVWLDVTHGFRHLPMIAMLAAFYLRSQRGAQIRGLYYGALEMTVDGRTPVIELDGLLELAEWVRTLSALDASGDYGLCGPLLARDGMQRPHAQKLHAASFSERTFQTRKAADLLADARKGFEDIAAGTPSDLFVGHLDRATRWCLLPRLEQREIALARAALAREDYIAAATEAYEALKSICLRREGWHPESRRRDMDSLLKDRWDEFAAAREQAEDRGWKLDWRRHRTNPVVLHHHLNYLRNLLVHGRIRGERHWRCPTKLTRKNITADLTDLIEAISELPSSKRKR